VIADDEALFREGVARLLEDGSVDVVAKVGTADELLRRVDLARPDAAIVDIRMPPSQTDEGLVAAQEIRRAHPQVGVLVLSHYLESHWAMRLLEEHPERSGYLLKERVSDVLELSSSIRRVAAGGSVLDPKVVERLVGQPRRGADRLGQLTWREREVLALMAEGCSNRAIAERLFVSDHTVQKHVKNIFAALGLPPSADDHRRVLAVLTFLYSR